VDTSEVMKHRFHVVCQVQCMAGLCGSTLNNLYMPFRVGEHVARGKQLDTGLCCAQLDPPNPAALPVDDARGTMWMQRTGCKLT